MVTIRSVERLLPLLLPFTLSTGLTACERAEESLPIPFDEPGTGLEIASTAEAEDCYDNISDITYDTTITITIDDRTLHGCGVSFQ